MTDVKPKFIPVCEPYLNGHELKYVTEAVSSGWISSSGQYVTAFEETFAKYCGVRYGVAVCNGTVALHLALRALNIGKGDEVIIPSFTMIASAFAVCYTGATPVFVDADPKTWNIDCSKIEEKITERTKAIMPVHIFGNPCDMEQIGALARKHGLHIVEDAAEAHGAEYQGRKVGSFSSISAFSFFANKNITTGEGGMVVTDNPEFADRCRYFKNLCFPLNGSRNYLHAEIGFNYRMSNLHAAIGLAQVEKADEYRAMRIRNASLYREFLRDVPGIIFQEDEEGGLNVHWMNAIVVDNRLFGCSRDQLISYLKNEGIDTRLLFISMHRQPSLQNAGCDCSGVYPVTDNLSTNGLYLPSASNLCEDVICYICDAIKRAACH
jgi:perosamine synthetase